MRQQKRQRGIYGLLLLALMWSPVAFAGEGGQGGFLGDFVNQLLALLLEGPGPVTEAGPSPPVIGLTGPQTEAGPSPPVSGLTGPVAEAGPTPPVSGLTGPSGN